MSAQSEATVFTYYHDNSRGSFLFLEAMRFAALRGVRTRYIYDPFATEKGVAMADFSPQYLNLLKASGVGIRALTNWERLMAFNIFKHIHGKILVADAGIKHVEVTFFGGRNLGDLHHDWLDNTFLMRLKRGSTLSNQIHEYVDSLWETIGEPKYKTQTGSQLKEKPFSSIEELRQAIDKEFTSDTGIKETQAIKEFIHKGEAPVDVLPVFTFMPSQVKFVSSGMMFRMKGIYVENQVTQTVHRILQHSKVADFSTIYFSPIPSTRREVEAFVQKGGQLSVLSNNQVAYSALFKGNIDGEAATLYRSQHNTLYDISRKAGNGGFVQAHYFNPRYDQFVYYHTKFLAGDKAVLLTSSNMNVSSDHNGEEIGFYFESKEFADYMRSYADTLKGRFFDQVDLSQPLKTTVVQRMCRHILDKVF